MKTVMQCKKRTYLHASYAAINNFIKIKMKRIIK